MTENMNNEVVTINDNFDVIETSSVLDDLTPKASGMSAGVKTALGFGIGFGTGILAKTLFDIIKLAIRVKKTKKELEEAEKDHVEDEENFEKE